MKLTNKFLKDKNACGEGCLYAKRNNLIGLDRIEVINNLNLYLN